MAQVRPLLYRKESEGRLVAEGLHEVLLRFLTIDGEEGFGRRAPLYGSLESECLNRLWMGDLLTSEMRIHWERMDTQQCLCCKKDCLESLEHLILDCDTLKDERINFLGEKIHNETWPISDLNNKVHMSGMETIRMLLGIGKELEEKE